jgi:hypothetical protein
MSFTRSFTRLIAAWTLLACFASSASAFVPHSKGGDTHGHGHAWALMDGHDHANDHGHGAAEEGSAEEGSVDCAACHINCHAPVLTHLDANFVGCVSAQRVRAAASEQLPESHPSPIERPNWA